MDISYSFRDLKTSPPHPPPPPNPPDLRMPKKPRLKGSANLHKVKKINFPNFLLKGSLMYIRYGNVKTLQKLFVFVYFSRFY